jgi:phosphatidylglycerophosphatase A
MNDQPQTLPNGLSFWDPAALISTWFGCGLLPKAPGTWGSLAALPLAWVISDKFGAYALIGAGIAAFLLGLWSCQKYLEHAREKDPGSIVIDEVAGVILSLVPAVLPQGPDIIAFGLGFILFRIFDIMKPWPVNWLENKFEGALGVMLDDVGAALYAGICVSIYLIIL